MVSDMRTVLLIICSSKEALPSLLSPLIGASDDALCCAAGDFPDVTRYREILSGYDLSTFPKLREKDVKALEETLSIDIPTLVKQVKVTNGVPSHGTGRLQQVYESVFTAVDCMRSPQQCTDQA